jgi:hypothetical protein
MKKLLFGAVALTMLATACKKSDDGGTPNGVTINGTTYTPTAGSFTKSGNMISIAGVNGSTSAGAIYFEFPGTSEPAAGTYTIVSDSVSTLTSGTVSFSALTGTATSGTFYGSTGTGGVKVTVANNGGKLSISMPAAPAKESGGTATVNVSCNASE